MSQATRTDEELIEAAVGGDHRAWGDLVERFAPLIWSVGRGCGLRQEDAEDVAQVVFTSLVRRLPHLVNPEALSGWLVVSAKRESWRVSARNRRRAGASTDIVDPEAPEEEPESEQFERQHAVRASMQRLDRRCQALLMELFGRADSASYEEIAQRLGLAANSVGPTRRRCLEKLLKDLQESSTGVF